MPMSIPIPVYHTRMLSLFYRQLATLITSGMPIIETMQIVATQGGNSFFRSNAGRIQQLLLQGHTLGDAFVQLPEVFPAWHVDIIQYSEAAGRLADGLNRLADYLEKDYGTQLKLMVGLAYPVLMLHIALFFMPVARGILSLPAYLMSVLSTLVPLYAGIFLVYALIRLWNNSRYKIHLDALVLSIPLFGRLMRQFALTRFIRALQSLSASGVNIGNAWRMAGWACGNSVIEASLLRGLPNIESGEALSTAFTQARVFSPTTIGMIVAAEKSGSIVQTLNAIATASEKENEAAIGVLTSILPVFIYLAIAGFIAFLIITFYAGYFNRIFSF